MGAIKAKWKGNQDNLFKRIDEIGKSLAKGSVKSVQESVFAIHSTAVELLQDNTNGTPQTRYNPKREVSASMPGDAPNTDTGRAVQSIDFEFTQGGKKGRVGTDLRYLRDLEFGTKNMEARPWLSTAIRMNEDIIEEIFIDNANKEIKAAGK